MKDRGSRSAETSALQRALHTLHGEEPKVFEDPLALDLAGAHWKWMIAPRPLAWLLQKSFPWMMPMVAHHLARARYVEERLDQLVEQGLQQYALVGAGMDSFAFRRPELAGRLAVFEIDHPGTQRRKRRRLRRLRLAEPSHVTYVAADLEKVSLGDALSRSGFDRQRLSLFAWMGVVPYLTEASIASALRDMAGSAAPGSEIVFDTLDRASLVEGRQKPAGRRMFRAAERMGEPMITGFDPPEWEGMLEEAGLRLVELVSPATFAARWFAGRRDGLTPWEHVYVVRARVS